MSGGCYDYLYSKDDAYDHLKHLAREVMRMAKDINTDHPSRVADELMKLSIMMENAEKLIGDKWELLRNAMKAWGVVSIRRFLKRGLHVRREKGLFRD